MPLGKKASYCLDGPRMRVSKCLHKLAGVLDSILKVQKMDVHDIEGIHPLLTTLLQRHAPASLSEDSPQSRQIAPCASTEADMASPSGHKAPAGNSCEDRDAALERLLTTDFEAAADTLRGYLVAATAKDCSLMITFAPCLPGPAPSGDSRHDSSDTAGVSRATAGHCGSEVCRAETGSRQVSSSAAGVLQPVGELDSCKNHHCAKTRSKEVAAGIAEAAARPLSMAQEWTSSNEHAVESIRAANAGQKLWVSGEWLPLQQEDPSVGSAVQHGEAGTWFRYKVAVVDLDLKPLSKLEQHLCLDQQILDCVLKRNGTAAPGAQ